MKNIIRNIAIILLGVAMLAYLLITAITDLTNKADLHTITLDSAVDVLQVEHSMNGLIPIGTDYYYVGVDEETYDAYLIKGSKKWLRDNFDYDYMALDANGVQIVGLAKKVSDYETARELGTQLSQLEDVNYPLGTSYCIDLGYKFTAILKLFDVALIIIVVITGIWIFKNRDYMKSVHTTVWTVVLMITLALTLIVLT